MKIWKKGGLLACIGLAGALLAGCGGGGSASQNNGSQSQLATDATHGALSFRIVFPTAKRSVPAKSLAPILTRGTTPGNGYDGAIPLGSHSVTIRLTNPATGALIAPIRVVSETQRPNGINNTISVGFGLLPVGPVKVDIAAYPDLTANGNPLAAGSASGQIVARDTTVLDVLMSLTISSLTLSPKTQTLHSLRPPTTGQVTAAALDANGQPLLYPLQYDVDNTQVLTIESVSSDFTVATLTAVPGQDVTTTVTVTVTEPNSGMTATAQVIVTP